MFSTFGGHTKDQQSMLLWCTLNAKLKKIRDEFFVISLPLAYLHRTQVGQQLPHAVAMSRFTRDSDDCEVLSFLFTASSHFLSSMPSSLQCFVSKWSLSPTSLRAPYKPHVDSQFRHPHLNIIHYESSGTTRNRIYVVTATIDALPFCLSWNIEEEKYVVQASTQTNKFKRCTAVANCDIGQPPLILNAIVLD